MNHVSPKNGLMRYFDFKSQYDNEIVSFLISKMSCGELN